MNTYKIVKTFWLGCRLESDCRCIEGINTRQPNYFVMDIVMDIVIELELLLEEWYREYNRVKLAH